ncbi:hypothetical protein B0H14DRAFT_2557470 [Mycena olivaceomarginata]|nr:hypothetical protein B0H14DRAFT_2557470 [Mycena olivaceomarginata]
MYTLYLSTEKDNAQTAESTLTDAGGGHVLAPMEISPLSTRESTKPSWQPLEEFDFGDAHPNGLHQGAGMRERRSRHPSAVDLGVEGGCLGWVWTWTRAGAWVRVREIPML